MEYSSWSKLGCHETLTIEATVVAQAYDPGALEVEEEED